MAKKKEKTAELLQEQLENDIRRWHDIYENGCSDPFWPDGVNLNLKRNHIIYGLRQLAELDSEPRQLTMFEMIESSPTVENDERVPPKVPDNYMAHDRPCNYFYQGAKK